VIVLCLTLSLFNGSLKAQDCFAYMDFYSSVYPICSPQWLTLTADIRNPTQNSNGFAYGTVYWYNQETGGQPFASQDVESYYWSDVTASQDIFAENGKTVWVSYYDKWAMCESQREPFTFVIESTPPSNLFQEYAFLCGPVAKIKVNSYNNPSGLYTLYKQNQSGIFEYVNQNTTGYFEVANYDPNSLYVVSGNQGSACTQPTYFIIDFENTFSIDPPSVSGNFSIVSGNTTTIHAAGDNFSDFRWYNSANALVGTGTSFTTPVLTARADYHVEGFYNEGTGCASNAAWVTVMVTQPPPPPPVCDNEMQVSLQDPPVICSPTWVHLTASMANPSADGVFSGSIKWYYTETGGQPFEEDLISMSNATEISASTINAIDVSAHPTVWVTYYNTFGQCEPPRQAFTVTIYPAPAWNLIYAHACGNVAKLKLNGNSSTSTYYLYKETSGDAYTLMDYNSTGYFEFSDYDPSGLYFVMAGNANGCFTNMGQVGFQAFDPSAPAVTGNTTLPSGASTTLTANGNEYFYKWYDGNGNYLYNGSSYTTPVLTDNIYNYKVQAISEDEVCTGDFATVTVTVKAPTITYVPLYNSGNFSTKAIDQTKPVGAVSGIAGANGGAVSYSIPVYAPPGTNGQSPGISVSYSSQSVSGIVGYGWSITGLSVVGRTGKDLFHDGVAAPVSLTDQDAFTLNGMRLNPISGANGANGTEYAGEAESFSKIISHGGSLNNPDWFEVIQKDGTKMEFGNSIDSRILTDDGSNVVMWQLNRIIDINGNYVLFNYDKGYRDNRIDEILYTGNIYTGLTPYNSIKFNYGERSDVTSSYEAGASFTSKHILNSITVKSEERLVKTYQFNYGFDGLYSLLKEVVETGSDGTSLNSTAFLYEDPVHNLQIQSGKDLKGAYDFFAGDFDADGKTDLLAANFYYDQFNKYHTEYEIRDDILNSPNYIDYMYELSGNAGTVAVPDRKFSNFLTSDYNGDGRDDVVLNITDIEFADPYTKQRILKNVKVNYTGSFNPSTGSLDCSPADYPAPDNGSNYRFIYPNGNFFVPGDFDGDGMQDYILILGRKLTAGDPTPSGDPQLYKGFMNSPGTGVLNKEITNFGIPTTADQAYITNTIAKADIVTPFDFDGDGKQELLVTGNGQCYVLSFQKTGSGSGASFTTSIKFVSLQINPGCQIFPGDFNNDSKTDFLVKTNYNWWKIVYSTGTGFTTANFHFNQDPVLTGTDNDDKVLVSDFNGDGKSDILHAIRSNDNSSTRFVMYYSRGDVTSESFPSEEFSYPKALSSLSGSGFVVGDFDGDGRADLMNKFFVNDDADYISFNPGVKGRLLTKITDGHDVTYEFKYKRLTDVETDPDFYQRTVPLEGSDNGNPLYYVKMPVYVVSDFISPNGLANGQDITSYSYRDAVIYHGKGFLGFKTVISKNNLTGITSTTENRINMDYAIPYTVRQVSELTATGQKIAEKISTYSFTNLSTGATDPKRFIQHLDRSVQIDHLTESAIATENTFDNYGNATTVKTMSGTPFYDVIDPLLTIVMPIEEITTTSTFGAFNTPVPARPVNVATNKNRSGMPDANKVTEYTYTTNGLAATQTDFVGQPKAVTSTFTYDPFGNLATAIVSTAGLNSRLSTITYDTKGRLPVSKQQTGSGITQTETFDYDYRWGKVVTNTTPDCLTSTFEYDVFGRLNKTNLPAGFSVNASMVWDVTDKSVYYTYTDYPGGTPDVKIWYDKLGRETKKQVAGFNNQWLTTLTTYDARGNMETKTQPYYATETAFTTTYVYDDLNRLESASNPKGQVNYSYANLGGGQLELTVTAAGQQTTKITDATNKIISATDKGGQLEYTYDSWGNQTEVKLGGDVVLTNVYDSYGRQTSATERNSGAMTYEYDAFGQLAKQTDNNNNTYTMLYDELGRVISRQGPEGTTLYEYYKDPVTGCSNNSLAKVSGINGVVNVYEYDVLKRLQKETTTINSKQFPTQYDHDTYGQITKITYPSGVVVNRTYDNNGNLLTVTGGDNGAPTTLFTATSMNGYGQYTAYTLGNNRSTQNSYTYGYPTQYYTAGIQDLNFNFDYTKGNLLSRHDGIKNLTETFGYDDQNRLTSTTVNNIPQLTIDFDKINGVSLGNIDSKTDAGKYRYSDTKKNQVAYVTNPAGPQLNPVTISTNDQVITYTQFQKTASITEGNNELDYVYGADYQRAMSILKQNNSIIETKYYLGDYEELITSNNITRQIHYVSGGNGLCAIIERENGVNNFNFVYTDYLGSILTVTDINGNVTAEQNFDAWGRYRNPVDWQYYATATTAPNVPVWLYRGYTGHEHLPAFALINMNGRLYDPVQGRMLSADNYVADVFGTQSYNRYSYALNNPLSYVDQDGNNPALIIAAIIGAYMGGMMANNDVNPFKWDFSEAKTWGYMIGGAAISLGGAEAGMAVANSISTPVFSAITGGITGSFLTSLGMNILTGGASPVSISFVVGSLNLDNGELTVGYGPIDYNISYGKFEYLGKKGNSPEENISFAIATAQSLYEHRRAIFLTDSKKTFMGKVWTIARRFTWELPQELLGMAALDLYGVDAGQEKATLDDGTDNKNVTLHKGTFAITTGLKGEAGVTLGNISILGPNANPTHEWGHTVQSKILGPLYVGAAVLSFGRAALEFTHWKFLGVYSKFPVENWAWNLGNNYRK
jgi:RHS repeat-associated protein